MLALSPAADSLVALDAAIDDVTSGSLDAVTAGALGDDLVHIRRQIDRLEAEFSRRLLRFDRNRAYAATGALSSVAWLRNACRLSGGAAVDRVQVARTLPELPETESALRNADIGFQHAVVIARCATDVGTEAVRSVEPTLVEAARKLDAGGLNLVARYLRHCIDPDGALQADNQNYARRSLHISQTFDGVFFLDGRLDAEGGELVRTVLNALSGPRAPGDERRPDQRRADALVELASRQLQAGDLPGGHGQRPHITVSATAATLRGDAGSPPGELTGAGPVSIPTTQRVACDAVVTEVELDGDGHPLTVGRASRVIPAAIRTALMARDRGCGFPGCDRPREWTDAHHLVHWANGGETSVANLVLLCRRHHRLVHEAGWQLSRAAEGGWVAKPP